MSRKINERADSKIGSEFGSRLRRLKRGQKVHVLLILAVGGPTEGSARVKTRKDRQEAITALHDEAAMGIAAIDHILARTGGRRLAAHPDAMGCLPIEATAAGIRELAVSKQVKAILEDQAIWLLARP
ncbi:MAG TPA: hypothetical protein VMW75_14290 [Thermoanaerobaculia bacterium]|nr:hypothetical protein [Thermoanaerobaculia bacterium]